MKTQTFARLSLLIPFMLWVILLLVEILANTYIPADSRSGDPSTLPGLMEMGLLFYVIGILFWLIPYLMLSIALLILSFRSRVEVLRYMFMLSPFAMAILVMTEVTLLTLGIPGGIIPSSDLASTFKDATAFNVFVGGITLVWGYICVGIGFVGYKLLEHSGVIKDEVKPEIQPWQPAARNKEINGLQHE